jgi:hypothetical protein
MLPIDEGITSENWLLLKSRVNNFVIFVATSIDPDSLFLPKFLMSS